MAGVAQTMMSCTAVRGNAFMGTGVTSHGVAGGKLGSSRMVVLPRICAVKSQEECNEEECAPSKEVGKLSMNWKVEEDTKVTGTYPPIARTGRKWTGYVEKDTAGQTNIYAVEPTIYIAESAISTGNAGGSEKGSGQSLAVAVGLGSIAIASAASILFFLGKNGPAPMASTYSGPPLSYYIAKFTEETSKGSTPSAPVPPIPESPPLSEGLSISKPEVAIQFAISAVSAAATEL